MGWVFSLSWTSLGQLSTSSWLNDIMQDLIVYPFILNATYPKWSFILLWKTRGKDNAPPFYSRKMLIGPPWNFLATCVKLPLWLTWLCHNNLNTSTTPTPPFLLKTNWSYFRVNRVQPTLSKVWQSKNAQQQCMNKKGGYEKKACVCRESNPGLLLGRQLS